MHRFGIGGIYCPCCILIYILVYEDLGLTVENLDRPYLILFSGHQVATRRTELMFSRERERERDAQLETR
jgi:hypothetical protein